MGCIVIFCRINVNDQGPERWKDLYSILAAEGRHVSEVEGDGHCLLQALEEAFWRDYDIPYPIPKIIKDVAQELVTNAKYTRYYTQQLDQNEVSKQFTKNMRSKHGKMLTELYIPAIANACNIQVNIIPTFLGLCDPLIQFLKDSVLQQRSLISPEKMKSAQL